MGSKLTDLQGKKEEKYVLYTIFCLGFFFQQFHLLQCLAECSWKRMSFRKLCVELKFSGSRYVLGPTSFLWHVQRFASASYGGHLSGPKWLPLKACPHVRTRSTHPTKAEWEREIVSLCVKGWWGEKFDWRKERGAPGWMDNDFWLHLNNLQIGNLCIL